MAGILDTLLVGAAVALAVVYLIVRKLRSARRQVRSWETGRTEACDECLAMKIRERRLA